VSGFWNRELLAVFYKVITWRLYCLVILINISHFRLNVVRQSNGAHVTASFSVGHLNYSTQLARSTADLTRKGGVKESAAAVKSSANRTVLFR
jgi:hypothetical protein